MSDDLPPEAQQAFNRIMRRRQGKRVDDAEAKEIMDEVSRRSGYDVMSFMRAKREMAAKRAKEKRRKS